MSPAESGDITRAGPMPYPGALNFIRSEVSSSVQRLSSACSLIMAGQARDVADDRLANDVLRGRYA